MPEPQSPDNPFAVAIEAVAAGMFPSLSPAERLERARQSMGLEPVAAWTEGRMVYVETRVDVA